MKKLFTLSALVLIIIISSCKKDKINPDDDIGGNQSPYGEVGNSVNLTVGQFDIADAQAYVSKLENGVSTFTCLGSTTNSNYIELIKQVPLEIFPGTLEITGNSVKATLNVKITDKGSQLIFNDGSKLTLVKYDAKVGDKFSSKVGSYTLENEVIEKSSDNDYFWGGIMIKVIKVKSKSVLPGVLYVENVYNHKFGFVGMAVHFEDGSVKYAEIEN